MRRGGILNLWVGLIEEWKNGYKVLVKRDKGRIVNIEYLVSPCGELMRLRGLKENILKIIGEIAHIEAWYYTFKRKYLKQNVIRRR